MGEGICRREVLRRSVLLGAAAAAASVGARGVLSAKASRWAVPQLPGQGTLLGAAAHEPSETLYAAIVDGGSTRILSVPFGADRWSELGLRSDGRSDRAFCAASDGALVVAGATRHLVKSRTVGVYRSPEGRTAPPVQVLPDGSIADVADNAEETVEVWALRPSVVTSRDGGQTWAEVDLGAEAPSNAWFDVAVADPRRPGVVALFGSGNSDAGLAEGFRSVVAAVAAADGRAVGPPPPLPDLAEGSWNAAAALDGTLVVAGRDTYEARLVRSSGGAWRELALPKGAKHVSPVALAASDGQLLMAGLDELGATRLWRTASVQAPSWVQRPVPISVAVGTHPRSIVTAGGADEVVFAARGNAPQVAEQRS